MPTGILINSTAIFTGGLLGYVCKKRIPQKLTETLPNIFGLSALCLGITLMIQVQSLTPVILALIVGTITGELLKLEQNTEKGLRTAGKKLSGNLSTEQFDLLISIIVLFCFSGAGIFGSLDSGISGDHSVLISKSVLDFFTAAIFGVSAGYMVALIAIPQCLFNLLLFFSASFLLPLINDGMLLDFKSCGGIITMAVGFKILKIKKISVLNMVPSLIFVLIFSYLWMTFM